MVTPAPESPPELRHTDAGTALGILPPHGGGPAATVLVIVSPLDALADEPYCRLARRLHGRGWNVASLDLPCHGDQRRADEPEGLEGWAARTGAGEDFVAPFCRQARDVVDHLVSAGIADPSRLAVAGTSRAGFLAFHAAARDPRLAAVGALAPVSDLRTLTEFAGQDDNPLVARLALLQAVDALADRQAWIAIGHADQRVGTDKVVAFADALTAAGQARGLRDQVTLRIFPTPGHRSFPEWHDEAAAWFQRLRFIMDTSGR
jgi:dienelactone hydrolase